MFRCMSEAFVVPTERFREVAGALQGVSGSSGFNGLLGRFKELPDVSGAFRRFQVFQDVFHGVSRGYDISGRFQRVLGCLR